MPFVPGSVMSSTTTSGRSAGMASASPSPFSSRRAPPDIDRCTRADAAPLCRTTLLRPGASVPGRPRSPRTRPTCGSGRPFSLPDTALARDQPPLRIDQEPIGEVARLAIGREHAIRTELHDPPVFAGKRQQWPVPDNCWAASSDDVSAIADSTIRARVAGRLGRQSLGMRERASYHSSRAAITR